MRRRRRYLAALAVTTFLAGCPPEEELTLVNNSGEDLVVVTRGERVSWRRGATVRIGGDEGIPWTEVWFDAGTDGVTVPRLSIDADGDLSVYRLRLPGAEGRFLDRSTGLYRRGLRMEADRKLYAVYIDTDDLADRPPSQPTGFPISPSLSPLGEVDKEKVGEKKEFLDRTEIIRRAITLAELKGWPTLPYEVSAHLTGNAWIVDFQPPSGSNQVGGGFFMELDASTGTSIRILGYE